MPSAALAAVRVSLVKGLPWALMEAWRVCEYVCGDTKDTAKVARVGVAYTTKEVVLQVELASGWAQGLDSLDHL